MEIRRLNGTTSTNDYLLALINERATTNEESEVSRQPICVVTSYQSAGKGMGSNTWESEEGKNLLFSILLHPEWLTASMQYLLSMAEALAIYDVLATYTDGISIKWPNDIYWHDKKVSGTRIDGNIKGRFMADMIIGTGININQREFHSDAPNPVSLYNIIGRENDTEEILKKVLTRFEYYYEIAKTEWESMRNEGSIPQQQGTIINLYHSHLYRNDGQFHVFEDKDGRFNARIDHVKPNGLMTLQRMNGTLSTYEFKEVRFIL